MLKQEYDRVHEYVAGLKKTLTEDLRTLALVPSVKGEPAPGAPFGKECARALETAKAVFAAHGIQARIWPESGYLIAEVGEGERCFGLVAHSDVVGVDNNWTLCEPFAAEVRDGFVIGRGTSDNKSGIVSSLYAVLALRDLAIPFNSRIWLIVGSCEENNMHDMRRFTEEQTLPDASIIPDMMYPVGRGEKGVLRLWAVSRQKLTSVLDFSGGTTPNVVLGKATMRFAYRPELEEAFKDLGDSIRCEREEDELVLTALGSSRHSAWPYNSINAAKLLTDALSSCPELPEEDRDLFSRSSVILEGYYGEGLRIDSTDPDFGKVTCGNGLVRLRDGRLALSFDIRFGPALNGKDFIDRITARLDELGFDTEITSCMDGFIIPEDDPVLQTLLRCYGEITGTESPKPVLANAGTYARVLKRAYSTAPYLRYPDPFDLPAGHGRAHQPDEFVTIDGIVDGAAMLAAMLISLDRMER